MSYNIPQHGGSPSVELFQRFRDPKNVSSMQRFDSLIHGLFSNAFWYLPQVGPNKQECVRMWPEIGNGVGPSGRMPVYLALGVRPTHGYGELAWETPDIGDLVSQHDGYRVVFVCSTIVFVPSHLCRVPTSTRGLGVSG